MQGIENQNTNLSLPESVVVAGELIENLRSQLDLATSRFSSIETEYRQMRTYIGGDTPKSRAGLRDTADMVAFYAGAFGNVTGRLSREMPHLVHEMNQLIRLAKSEEEN